MSVCVHTDARTQAKEEADRKAKEEAALRAAEEARRRAHAEEQRKLLELDRQRRGIKVVMTKFRCEVSVAIMGALWKARVERWCCGASSNDLLPGTTDAS